MLKNFYTAVKERRSFYGLSNESSIPDNRIEEIIKESVKYSPSAFNSQSARVVLLLGKNHHQLWEITKEILKKIVPADKFRITEEKLNSFQAGYGTILFFEDNDVIKHLQTNYSAYKDNFPVWSQQSNGMLQYIVWTALESEGLGVSLQHYNPLINDEVAKNWNIPGNWSLIAQMPFGKPTAIPDEKTIQPIEERIKIFK